MRAFAQVVSTFVLVVSIPVLTFGQTPTGQINGTVSDATGAVVPGAALKLTNRDTGIEAAAATNDSGNYLFLEVRPGTYVLQAAKAGFKTAIVESFTINVNQVLTQDVRLSVGETAESVQVKAEAPVLQGSTSELGTVIAQQTVERIPLNGRNFTQLMLLTPGVTPVQTEQSANSTTGTGGDPGVPGSKFVRPATNGQWNRSDMFLMDGVLNVSRRNSYTILPSIDAIQEFKLQSHNDKGEYGGVMGGVVNLVTKSGTNKPHGTLAEFVRNNDFNARNPFTDITPGRGPAVFHQNQFGATLGGPVYVPKVLDGRNKTFFFFDYDGWRYAKAAAALYRDPTQQELSGNLSDWAQQIYDPMTTRPNPANSSLMIRDPFPNNQIPASRIDPMVVSFIKTYFDVPNITPINLNNVLNNTPVLSSANNIQIRLDHRLGDKTTLFARYNSLPSYDTSPTTNEHTIVATRPRKQLVLAWDQIFSPAFVLSTRVAYTSQPYYADPASPVSFNDLVQAGYPTTALYGFPDMSISGVQSSGLGGDSFMYEVDHYYQWSEDLSWIKGNHAFKFGSLVYYDRRRTLDPTTTISFSTTQTADPSQTGGVASGVGLASALLGLPSAFTGQRERLATNMSTWAFYAQDEWRVSPTLTLNLSLRHEFVIIRYQQPFAATFDEATGDWLIGGGTMPPSCLAAGAAAPCIPGGGTLASIAGGNHIILASNPDIREPHYRNLSPRVGVAWRFAPWMVLRGGFSIVYDTFDSPSQEANDIQGGWPNNNRFSATYNLTGNPLTTLEQVLNTKANPFPDPAPWTSTSALFDPDKKPGVSDQYNIELQRQVGSNLLVSLAYVGSRNRDMSLYHYINTSPTPGPGTVAQVNALRPFQYIANALNYGTDLGKSWYNALQFQLNRRFSNGLTAILAYTWSKAMDNGNSGWMGSENGAAGVTTIQNSYDLKSSREVSGYNVPHNVWAGGSWELPFGKGKSRLGSGPLAWVLGDWRTNFIQEMRSGQPWSPYLTGDLANIGQTTNYLHPNLIGDPYPSHPTVQHWVNTAAFGIPVFSFGNLGSNVFRSASVFNTDFSLTREFHVTEGTALEFRAECFNLFNIMNYSTPNLNLSNSNFGTISSLAAGEYPRQFQFGLRLSF